MNAILLSDFEKEINLSNDGFFDAEAG